MGPPRGGGVAGRTGRGGAGVAITVALGRGLTIAILLACPWLASATAPSAAAPDRVDATVEATVDPSLKRVDVIARYKWIPGEDRRTVDVALIADAATAIPEPLPPAAEPQLFPSGYERGGYEGVTIQVDGRACAGRRRLELVVPIITCDGRFLAGRPVEVVFAARLTVPVRFGPFGAFRRQLTLLGGWFPTLGRPGRMPPVGTTRVELRVPNGFAAVLGATYSPFVPTRGRGYRRVEAINDATTMPLVVLPPRTGSRMAAHGQVRWVSGRRHTEDRTAVKQAELTVSAVDGAYETVARAGLAPRVTPLLVVEAPLRRHLARAGPGVVLVSDRAFRLPPFSRFFRFHRYPVAREVLTAWAWRAVARDGLRHVTADAVGAFLRDRLVQRESGYAEDLFDVLSFWSFIPAVDSLLYAPQTAFIGAYFRLVDESDPLRTNLFDPPSSRPRGRILYEKLRDRAGPRATAAAMNRLAVGERWPSVLVDALAEAEIPEFLTTWLGPYPEMQYGLQAWTSRPVEGAACAPADQCHEARVDVRRTGAAAVEPVQLRLTDDDGGVTEVWTETSSAAARTVTATLAAPLDLVELDPHGRIAETPTAEVPSPKHDNRSRPRWRVLLNSFNLLASPTAGTLNTTLDLGISQVREVRWRYGLTAGFGPDALVVSGRVARRFGAAVTPDRLAQWIGLSLGGRRLRSDFAGQTESSYALTSSLFYGYDDRQTAWAPEAGVGVRASLTYNRVFGPLDPAETDGEGVTRDAVALTVRGLKSWRIQGRHQLSLRGSVGGYLAGRPQSQLLFFLGGRPAVRGYVVDAEVGRYRAIASGEWVHTLLPDTNENVVELTWATRLDGALFADVAAIGDDFEGDLRRRLRADVGYGFRIYLDYFGIRPGVMAVDVAFPLLDDRGRPRLGGPEVYIDFSQSFLTF